MPSLRSPFASSPFIALCLIALFGFGNIAVFYGLHPYLASIGIPPYWAAWILAAEPLAAFLLRPLVSPWLRLSNALPVMRASLLLIAVALSAYPFARTIPALLLLRVFHGAAFVTLVSATTALLVHFIPPDRSGQGFGIFSLTTMLPFALMPAFTEALLPHVADASHAYAWMALMVVPAFLLLFPLGPSVRKVNATVAPSPRPALADLRLAMRPRGVAPMLGASLCIFTASTLLFFFMKDFGASLGLANTGLFFTVSTGATVLTRAVGNPLFDRVDRGRLLVATLVLLALCYAGYAVVRTPVVFLLAAALFGTCMGVALPLAQASLFLLADPTRRGLTTNLALSTMDAAYFIGPWLGGIMLAAGMPRATLFALSAALALAAALLVARAGLRRATF